MDTVNKYRLQGRDSDEYFPSNLRQINRLIEHGQAVWVGTDGSEDSPIVTHYADRRFHE
jgi:hypothetical protein